jgi:hypothetical protein
VGNFKALLFYFGSYFFFLIRFLCLYQFYLVLSFSLFLFVSLSFVYPTCLFVSLLLVLFRLGGPSQSHLGRRQFSVVQSISLSVS